MLRKVFSRISTISPKDLFPEDENGKQNLYFDNVEDLFNKMINSNRVIEDILEMENDKFTLILKKWNEKIFNNPEYRCIIYDRMYVAHFLTCGIINNNSVDKIIKEYIINTSNKFPENHLALDIAITKENEVIFIEFNLLDNELDMYGYDVQSLSPEIYRLIST